jgi:hypothetical protein
MPCVITSSAISRPVQWLIGRSLGCAQAKRNHLADLLCSDLRWLTIAWGILEPLTHRKIVERNGLLTYPPHPPTAHRLRFHSQLSPDVCVVFALGCCTNHTPSHRDLLGSAVPTHQFFQHALLLRIQCYHRWFGTTHLLCSFSFAGPVLPHAD